MNATTILLPAVFLVCSLTLMIELPVFMRVIMGVPLVFYLPGITLMMAFNLREGSREDHVFQPLLLSPIAMSLAMLALYAITGSVILSLKYSILLFLLLFIILALRRKGYAFGRGAEIPREIYLVSVMFCTLMVVSFLANPHLLVRSDSYYHVSVINEIQARGIPPMDPRLPDIPIKYYWMYHFFLSGWKELTGLSVFWVLFSFMLVNAFSFPYLVARFTRIFTDDRAKLICTPVFAIAGLGVASWILWPVVLLRLPFGDVTGAEEWKRILDEVHFNSHRVMYTLTPRGTLLTIVLDKFYTLTTYTYSISLFLLCTISVIGSSCAKAGKARYIPFLVLLFVGNFLFQILTGTALILMAVGSGLLLAVLSLKNRKTPPVFTTLVLPGVAIVSALLVLPYVRSLGSTGEGNAVRQFTHFGTTNLFSIMAPLIALFPFSARAIRKLVTTNDEKWRMLSAWIAALFVVAIFFNAGGTAEIKLVFFLFLLLLPLIAWELIDSLRRSRGKRLFLLSAWIFILFVVPTALTVRGFLMDGPLDKDQEHEYVLNQADRELVEWVRENTGRDAVIMENKVYSIMPTYAGRRDFYSIQAATETFGYNDGTTARYKEIYHHVFSAKPTREEDVEYLRSRGFDLFVVIWDIDRERSPEIAAKFDSSPELFEKLFQGTAGTIYRFKK